jgi:hypothetical protein
VEFDDQTVKVRVLAELEPEWNQTFQFSDIRRVCFEDGGMFSSDIVYVSLHDREKPAVIPTEAAGGHELFGALCDRGYFPERVWRRAIGDTSGDCTAGLRNRGSCACPALWASRAKVEVSTPAPAMTSMHPI